MIAIVILALATLHPAFNPLVPTTPPSPPSWYGGRVHSANGIHVGVRPAVLIDNDGGQLELGVGATVQVRCDLL